MGLAMNQQCVFTDERRLVRPFVVSSALNLACLCIRHMGEIKAEVMFVLLAGAFLRPTGGRAWNPVEILPPDEAPASSTVPSLARFWRGLDQIHGLGGHLVRSID